MTGRRPDLGNLTKRQREVLDLVAQGKSNQEIADTIYVAPHTVKNYVSEILHVLRVENRTQAALVWSKAHEATPTQVTAEEVDQVAHHVAALISAARREAAAEAWDACAAALQPKQVPNPYRDDTQTH